MSRVETAVQENVVDCIAVIYPVGTFHAYRVPVIKQIKTTSTVKLQRSENASCQMGSGKALFLLSDAHWWPQQQLSWKSQRKHYSNSIAFMSRSARGLNFPFSLIQWEWYSKDGVVFLLSCRYLQVGSYSLQGRSKCQPMQKIFSQKVSVRKFYCSFVIKVF